MTLLIKFLKSELGYVLWWRIDAIDFGLHVDRLSNCKPISNVGVWRRRSRCRSFKEEGESILSKVEDAQQFAWKAMRKLYAVSAEQSKLFRFRFFYHCEWVYVNYVIQEVKQSPSRRYILDEVTRLMDIGTNCINNESILESNQFILKLDQTYLRIIVKDLYFLSYFLFQTINSDDSTNQRRFYSRWSYKGLHPEVELLVLGALVVINVEGIIEGFGNAEYGHFRFDRKLMGECMNELCFLTYPTYPVE